MLISFEQANNALLQHYTSLWSIVDGAWNDYKTLIPENVQSIASPRSRASLVHDFMVQRALGLSEQAHDVSFVRQRMMSALVFKSEHGFIAMRLKKMDKDGFSRNNPTKQVSDFRNQVQIDGMDAKHHLEIGYILTDDQGSISSIELVCPSGGENYWMAEVTPTGSRENIFSLWEHRGEEEQSNTGFTVKKRIIESDKKDATTDSN